MNEILNITPDINRPLIRAGRYVMYVTVVAVLKELKMTIAVREREQRSSWQ